MNATYTEYTLTITPSVGSPIVYSGEAGGFELKKLLMQPNTLHTTDQLTGEVSGTYSLGGCCTTFLAVPSQVTASATLDDIPCII